MQKKTFVVFVDFRRTTKVFPTNFISAILSADTYIVKKLFHAYQKQNRKSFLTLW